jgi:predicted branched-subunit amino acid permease
LAGDILPASITAALGMALYGMFVAIVVPAATQDCKIRWVSLSAAFVSLFFAYCPVLCEISSGTRIIIVTLLVAGVAAWLCPMTEEASHA